MAACGSDDSSDAVETGDDQTNQETDQKDEEEVTGENEEQSDEDSADEVNKSVGTPMDIIEKTLEEMKNVTSYKAKSVSEDQTMIQGKQSKSDLSSEMNLLTQNRHQCISMQPVRQMVKRKIRKCI